MNNIKYKDLIGYSFTCNIEGYKKIIYYFGEMEPDSSNVQIYWKGSDGNYSSTEYNLFDIVELITSGSWILNQKFYRKDKLNRILK